MARQGKLVLPNLDGMDFVPVEIEAPVARPVPTTSAGKIDVITGDVIVRVDGATPTTRIAEIAKTLAS